MPISYEGPPPASAAWREGDHPGWRLFDDQPSLTLEAGGALPAVRVAYETFGTPRRDPDGRITNAVLVLHALTADAHVIGSPYGHDGFLIESEAVGSLLQRTVELSVANADES